MTMPTNERENLWGYAKRLRFVRQALLDAFPSRANYSIRILDVGCGNGSQLAVPLARSGYQVLGVDTDSRSIAHAREISKDIANARFLCMEVSAIPGEDLYDAVILSEVLEHSTDPAELFGASVARLTKEGVVIVTVPNGFGEFEIDSWIFRTLRLQSLVDKLSSSPNNVLGSTDNEENGHLHFFTRSKLLSIFKQWKFAITRESASSVFSGPIAGHTLARIPGFIDWNTRTADKLPMALSSGWFFALKRSSSEKK